MYHVAEIVRDAKRDMHERYEGFSTWAAYTPFPFLYALGGQIGLTMQRKAPDLAKRAAVRTRDQIVDVLTTSQRRVVELRVTTTRTGQRAFYSVQHAVATAPLPSALEPLRSHAAVPALLAVEALAQFVTSEELPELYFVAKTSMSRSAFLRHVVLPPLGAAERVVHWVVILPSHVVFPTREDVETRTDLFLHVSTTRVQSIVEYLYSATEVLDQHWSMVQWNILGRGPYESLAPERRKDVMWSIAQRLRSIESPYKRYELMASIQVQNEMLYVDVQTAFPLLGGVPLAMEAVQANAALVAELESYNDSAFPCWFFQKRTIVPTDATQLDVGNINKSAKWLEFPPHENRRLERRYRWYQQQRALGRTDISSIVLVDEGRFEVCMTTMAMTPVYWPALETTVVCRSHWLYAQRSYGLAPYSASAAAVLENALTFYLAHYASERERLATRDAATLHRSFFASSSSTAAANAPHKATTMSVPLEGHLVEFKGPNDIMQHKRLLAGTTPFTSTRRVYRGDPRIKSDATQLARWRRAMACNVEDGSVCIDACSGTVDALDEHDDADIDANVDHLVLIVHGIGDALKTIDLINVVTLRSIVDCATSLRDLHREALRSAHFAASRTSSKAQLPRVEFLPIEWHSKLHLEHLDAMIRDVTLPAIPKLREFANDTILDVLFFMSPMFHQVILQEVATEMNRVVDLFAARHSKWRQRPKVSIVAHSLGAIICFDVLNHQQPVVAKPSTRGPKRNDANDGDSSSSTDDDEDRDNSDRGSDSDAVVDCESIAGLDAMFADRINRRSASETDCLRATNRHWRRRPLLSQQQPRRRSRTTSTAASTQHQQPPPVSPRTAPVVPPLSFVVQDLFCFGSPVGLFLNVRGQKLGRDFHLPTCKRLFNIYHPYDPVAYRIEPIVNPRRANSKAMIIRTFEGKLRFQYQLKNSFRVMWQTLRRWRRDFEDHVERSVRQIGLVEQHPSPPSAAVVATAVADAAVTEVAAVASTAIRSVGASATNTQTLTIDTDDYDESIAAAAAASTTMSLDQHTHARRRTSSPQASRDVDSETIDPALFGQLCQGAPIDYTLQENEIEIANEYLFALTAHVIYWSNRDASLFVAQKLILEPPRNDSTDNDDDSQNWRPYGVTIDSAFGVDDTETQTASLSSSSSSASSPSPAPVRRRHRRRVAEQAAAALS